MTLPRYLSIGLVLLGTAWQILAQTNLPAAKPDPATFRISLNAGITNVFVRRAGANVFDPAYDGQTLRVGDRLQTRANARIILISADGTTLRVGEFADLEIQADPSSKSQIGIMVYRAQLYFFHRGGPTDLKLRTRTASAAVRGTEFDFNADEEGDIQINVLDGEVALSNEIGEVFLRSREQGSVAPGRPPTKTAVIEAVNIIQWWLYYPAILDLDDLRFEPESGEALRESFSRYRDGDLLGALAAYPSAGDPISVSETIYRSALLLSVGKVEESEALLASLAKNSSAQNDEDRERRLAEAIRLLIASVKMQPCQTSNASIFATEWLAKSYHRQSLTDLKGALEAAYQATVRSPNFGFAWARVAELEFSFARTAATDEALSKALALSPRNAQALALRGFTLAARNELGAAIDSFDQALAADNALGNAWLGRGLCRIRRGDLAGGLEDLQTAVVVEPQRAVLRSYLGKAFALSQKDTLADHELDLAKSLDRADPTAWLYSALLNQQKSRFNEGIRDLEKSQSLNDNRALFRSQMLLDQDKSVRSANLASIYRDAGMSDVGRREAARAVTYDYANYSAHLFLSDSFNELRDTTRFNLRQEAVWFNELLLANLLAPVGAGRLSQTVTANEYSKLFESDGVGLASQTSWRSDDQFRQLASQYGTYGNTSWALDVDYQNNAGARPNNELNRLEWYTTLKHQLTSQDTVLLIAKYQDYSSGDNFQYYDPSASFRPNFKFEEQQKPILIGGFQHEWSPGVRTLLLGGRLVNEQKFTDLQAPQLLWAEDASGVVDTTFSQPFDVALTDNLEIYTAELNQIIQQDKITIVAGALWQGGNFDFANSLNHASYPSTFLAPVSASFTEPFERFKAYGYLTVEPIEKLWLTAGLAYDQMKMPSNFRSLPQSNGTEDRDLVEPKAAFVWSPLEQTTLRGIYAKSLGGVSLDESYRLEPTQLAGFAQSFRTVISESVVGSVAAPETEVLGLALDLKLASGTYTGVQIERITSEVERSIGIFRSDNGLIPYAPSTSRQQLDYEEHSVSFNVNQLLGDSFVLGANYRLTKADLKSTLPEISAVEHNTTYLHQIGGHLLYNHTSGFFARFDANYYQQSNRGYTPAQPSDEFVQLDLQAGYRFFHRKADMSVGILNLTDQDYRLNPLTIYSELPRERVFFARMSFRF